MFQTALLVSFASLFAAQEPGSLAARDWLSVDAPPVVDPGPDAQGRPQPRYAAGRVLVRFGAGLRDEVQRSEVLGERYRVARTLARGLDLHLVEILDGSTVEEAMRDIGARRGILYATPDHVVSLRDTFPNDPSFSEQFGKHNTGQTGGTADADMDAPEAWDYGTGSSDFVVAIVDGGTQLDHPDLIANRWENSAEVNGLPGVDDDGNGYVDDLYGWDAYNGDGTIPVDDHSTHVTGIAVAKGDNGIGIAGVSWNSKWVTVAGSSGFTSTVVAAYSYALDLKDDWLASGGTEGANVIAANSSFGVDFADCSSPQFAPWNDMFDLMGASGILSIGATINSSFDVDVIGDVPTGCTSDYLISVTALDHRNRRNFSGFGATTIDLGAAGEDVYSTYTGGSYGYSSGTSMATPQVTGAVAYLHSVAGSGFSSLRASNPAAAALAIKQAILDNVDVVSDLATTTVSGGALNIKKAADALVGSPTGSANYCGPAAPASTGQSAVMTSAGSLEVAVNMFTLRATSLPVGQTTLFLASRDESPATPVASSVGLLCLGGQIGRLMGSVQPASASGEAQTPLDLTAIPQGVGTVPVLAGETWYFQAWFRDAQLFTPTSNFTDGLRVTFE